MAGIATKARTRRSRGKPSKAALEKRQPDATSSEGDPLPTKRARLTRTDTERLGVEKRAEQAAGTTTLQQPKPKPSKRPYASFLEGSVEPVYPHSHAKSLHSAVSEWLESVGSDREKGCRSDSHLCCSDPVSSHLTRSSPEMSDTLDADGFVVPPMPASTGSRSYQADSDTRSVMPSDATPSSGRSSGGALVEGPLYRKLNLAANKICLRPLYEKLPEHIASLVDHVLGDRDSPGPSPDQVRQEAPLNALWMGAGEPQVENYFKSKIFPLPEPSDSLNRSDKQPMAKHTVPISWPKFKLSTPVPDMLYGYNSQKAFPHQQPQLIEMEMEMEVANQHQSLLYPFFLIEFKGDAGSLWAATNQCLGGAASCVNLVERLNGRLRKCEVQPIGSAAFSIAMNGTEARLYISWKHSELDYHTASVGNFLLHNAEDYIEFRKVVLNIIDWGENDRLNEIRRSLETLLEQSRRRASAAAKSRQPPADGSATACKKHKPSSSHRSNRTQGQSW